MKNSNSHLLAVWCLYSVYGTHWVVGMGNAMGEVVELDERGRLTIPSELRQMLRGRRVRVERGDENTLVIRPEFDSEALLKNIRNIRLRGERNRAKYDASYMKDKFGGVKD